MLLLGEEPCAEPEVRSGDAAQAALDLALAEVCRVNGGRLAQAAGLPANAPCLRLDGTLDLTLVDGDDALALDVLESSRFPRLVPEEWRRREDAELLLYRCAWLKSRFPVEFLAALMECAPSAASRQAAVAEAHRTRVPLLQADVNVSGRVHRVQMLGGESGSAGPRGSARAIRLPLRTAGGLSERDWVRIEHGRPYASIADVWARARLGRGSMADLAQSGAFDRFAGADSALRDAGLQSAAVRVDARARAAGAHMRAAPVPEHVRAHAISLTRQITARSRAAQRPEASEPSGEQVQLRLLADAEVPALAVAEPALVLPEPESPAAAPVESEGERRQPEAERPAPESEAGGGERVSAAAPAEEPEWFRGGELVEQCRPLLDELGVTEAGELSALRPGAEVVLAGLRVASGGGAGEPAELVIEDGTGRAEAVLGGDVHASVQAQIAGIAKVVLRGRLRENDDGGMLLEAEEVHDLMRMWRDWHALRG